MSRSQNIVELYRSLAPKGFDPKAVASAKTIQVMIRPSQHGAKLQKGSIPHLVEDDELDICIPITDTGNIVTLKQLLVVMSQTTDAPTAAAVNTAYNALP
jgi:hypothetical protein